MKKALITFFVIVLMLLIGAIIAFATYWIAITVFHANISRNGLLVNIIADAIIFCLFPLIYLYIKKTNKSKQLLKKR